jgi:hypothetical protein
MIRYICHTDEFSSFYAKKEQKNCHRIFVPVNSKELIFDASLTLAYLSYIDAICVLNKAPLGILDGFHYTNIVYFTADATLVSLSKLGEI